MRWVWFWVTLDSNANMQYIYRTGKEFWTTVDEFILLGKTITQGSNPPPHARLVLAQSFPNPSYHGVVTINYSLLTSGVVKLALYDLLGREIVVLDDSFRASGDYAVRFDTATLTAGVYFYRIFSGNTMKVRTLVVLK
jgi:hypothetical protein